MAKNKTEIHVTTGFDGELDATDVFVSLISQKYGNPASARAAVQLLRHGDGSGAAGLAAAVHLSRGSPLDVYKRQAEPQ